MTTFETAPRDTDPVRLTVGAGAQARAIAVRSRPGADTPVVWLGGFRSDMTATKAMALDAWAAEHGRPLVRFDYTGHGASGGRFEDATISTWLEDALAVLDRFVDRPAVLVGSSMGGWIACLAARARQGGVPPAGLVLIAPALDFTEDLMWAAFPPEVRAQLARDGVWYRPTPYAPKPDPIRLALIEDGRRHRMLTGPFDPGCPVHVLQGMDDPDVPWGHALRIVERLPAAGTLLTLIKDGDHRLSRPGDIELLLRAVAAIA